MAYINNIDILADKLDLTYKKEEGFGEFRNIISICQNYWYLFVLSFFTCMLGAFAYIQYYPAQWNIASKVLVEDEKNSPTKALTSGLNSDLASLIDVQSNVDNEVRILKSRSLIKSVINKLNLNVQIFDKGFVRSVELYDNAPFSAMISYKEKNIKTRSYSIQILNDNKFRFLDEIENTDVITNFGNTLHTPQYDITINKADKFKPAGSYKLTVSSFKETEKKLADSFDSALDDKQATVIDLQLSYPNPNKGQLILQTLMQIYLQNNLSNKIRKADSTMKFINNRLLVVGAELNNVENDLEKYKVQNHISDINAQSKALVEGANEYQNKLNENEVQLAVVDGLYKYVSDGSNPQVVPSSLITKDIAFGTAINAYNEMLLRKEQLRLTLTENSEIVQNLEKQIEVARKSLMASLKNFRNSLQVSKSIFRDQNSTIAGKVSAAPVKERMYLDFSRKQSLKQDLFLFLLQKREETAISQTATLSSCRILDNADSEEQPFAPKKSLVYLIGAFAGIILPFSFLSLKEIANIRINSKESITKHTDVPLLGEISRNHSTEKLLVYNNARSVISEQIRAIRTNLKYVIDNGKSNVILLTSSMSGEGKSFISVNLGNSIALSGKKVVLLELDLRKPKLLSYMGVENDYGFTNYAISTEKNAIDNLIKPSTFNENFFFISSGPIPPNPSELLMNERLPLLIAELKKKFDYVIIDSAPVGLVSDALIIEEFADVTFYIIRQNYTYKSQLGIVNDLYKTKKAKHMYLIVNDIDIKTNGVTGYGYGYGSYGYSNYEEKNGTVKGFFKKMMPSLK